MIKKILFTLSFIFILLLTVPNVKAATCTTKELNNLKQLATNINFSYELYDDTITEDHQYYFNVLAINFIKEFYISDSFGFEYRYDESLNINGIRTLRAALENTRIKFDIYASGNTNCADTKILSKEITLPYFNDYSLREECVGIEDFPLCQRYYSGYIESEEYFLKQVAKYKNDNTNIKNDNNIWDYIVEFVSNNLVLVVSISGVLLLIIIILVIRYFVNRKKIKIKI